MIMWLFSYLRLFLGEKWQADLRFEFVCYYYEHNKGDQYLEHKNSVNISRNWTSFFCRDIK